jgi:hypothetical protein
MGVRSRGVPVCPIIIPGSVTVVVVVVVSCANTASVAVSAKVSMLTFFIIRIFYTSHDYKKKAATCGLCKKR